MLFLLTDLLGLIFLPASVRDYLLVLLNLRRGGVLSILADIVATTFNRNTLVLFCAALITLILVTICSFIYGSIVDGKNRAL